MIASVLTMSPGDIKRAAIHDAYGVHKAVYSLFPGTQRTFLYHDQGGDERGRRVLILSQRHPVLPRHGMIESKVIPDSFLEFGRYAFQVRLNPVMTRSSSGKREAITDPVELLNWITQRASGWGFEVDRRSLSLDRSGVQTIKKGRETLTHNVAEYRGVLTVSDQEQFRRSFASGIGKAKAFGFGLLQVRPLA